MAGDDGPTLRQCTGKSKASAEAAAGRATGHPTPKARPSKRKAAGADMSGWMNACTGKEEADEEDDAAGSFEAPEKASSTMEAGSGPAKAKMLLSQEDIDSILNHRARTDRFREFQARVAREVEETGEFEVSEEYLNNVLEARAWVKEVFSTTRPRYPHLVWED